MICPHCSVAFHDDDEWDELEITDPQIVPHAWTVEALTCPTCEEPIVRLVEITDEYGFDSKIERRLIYPSSARPAPVGDTVPEEFNADYIESYQVLHISPKASAALSRRLLQAVLIEQGYSKGSLAQQIDAVLDDTELPSHLSENIDAIRNFGNFSAHPVTDITSLQIIDVEPQEAEWCLEIIAGLFDHYYVKPEASRKRLAELNEKLKKAGKPPAKT